MAVGHDIAASVRRSRFPARFLWPKATFAIATLRPKATFTIVALVAKGHTHRSLGQSAAPPQEPDREDLRTL